MTSHASRKISASRGVFEYIYMEYKKTPISTRDQVLRLKERGLIISDESLAEQYLHNISYYRLRAYTYPFQKNDEGEEHVFLSKDIAFEEIIDLYCFDRRLRALLFNAIEKIEVAMRTRLALTYSLDTNDGFWFLQDNLFYDKDKFDSLIRYEADGNSLSHGGELIKEIKRSNEDFIQHYFDKYDQPVFPPSWMTLEVVSMGTLSKLFAALNMNNQSSRSIARDLGLFKVLILRNWLHALSILRNICAHHSRLWNRRFTVALTFPNKTRWTFLTKEECSRIRNNKLFAYLSVILYLLQIISPGSAFKSRLIELIKERPRIVELGDMGFPEGWETYTLWR